MADEEENYVFLDTLHVIVFIILVWLGGKFVLKFAIPALVGEIFVGIIFGPFLLDFVPFPVTFMLVGEIGLMLLVIEAGLDVDLEMLKITGLRGVAVAAIGALVPFVIGAGIGLGLGLDTNSLIILGASMSPTSTGVALNIIRSCKVLNTPTGQVVIAAAVVDDIIAIILLSEISALEDPKPINFVIPVISSLGILFSCGFIALKIMPRLMHSKLLLNIEYKEKLVLGLIFASALALMPTCFYAGTSYFLGAFLAGFFFCSTDIWHHQWTGQVKRVMTWLLRIFFACTIGFEVPIKELFSPRVMLIGLLLIIAIFGKFAVGVFAFKKTPIDVLTLGFAMASRAEFSLIIAATAKESGIISHEIFASIIFAVLFSVIFMPFCLRRILLLSHKNAVVEINEAITNTEGIDKDEKPVYYLIQTKSALSWGGQGKLVKCLMACSLDIIDMRSFNSTIIATSTSDNPEDERLIPEMPTKETFVINEIYVKDQNVLAAVQPDKEKGSEILDRQVLLQKTVFACLDDPYGEVNLGRWLPGFVMSNEAMYNQMEEEIALRESMRTKDKPVSPSSRGKSSPNHLVAAETSPYLVRQPVNPRAEDEKASIDGSLHNRRLRRESSHASDTSSHKSGRTGRSNSNLLLRRYSRQNISDNVGPIGRSGSQEMLPSPEPAKSIDHEAINNDDVGFDISEVSKLLPMELSSASRIHSGESGRFALHHQLDGYVHTDAHDAFNLTSDLLTQRREAAMSHAHLPSDVHSDQEAMPDVDIPLERQPTIFERLQSIVTGVVGGGGQEAEEEKSAGDTVHAVGGDVEMARVTSDAQPDSSDSSPPRPTSARSQTNTPATPSSDDNRYLEMETSPSDSGSTKAAASLSAYLLRRKSMSDENLEVHDQVVTPEDGYFDDDASSDSNDSDNDDVERRRNRSRRHRHRQKQYSSAMIGVVEFIPSLVGHGETPSSVVEASTQQSTFDTSEGNDLEVETQPKAELETILESELDQGMTQAPLSESADVVTDLVDVRLAML